MLHTNIPYFTACLVTIDLQYDKYMTLAMLYLCYIPSGKVLVVGGEHHREYPGTVTREGAGKVSMLAARIAACVQHKCGLGLCLIVFAS